MISGSTAFNNAVNEGGHPYKIRISENGIAIDCEVFDCSIYKGSTGESAFSIGAVFVPYVELEISTIPTPLSNKEILVECGVQITASSTEWINIGYFRVVKVETSTVRTLITAVGRIAGKLSTVTPTLTTPVTIASLITNIQTAMRAYYSGFTIITTGVDTSGGAITEDVTDMTCRQLLEVVASLTGAYATENSAGNVVLFKYSTASAVSYTGTRMIVHPVVSGTEFAFTNVKVIQAEAYKDESGSIVPEVSYQYDLTEPVNYVITNPYMASQSMFDIFCRNCIGLTYRPATIELAYGDPRLEGTDMLQVTDTDGSVYYIPVMSIVHTLTGGIKSTITAPGDTEAELESSIQGPLTQKVNLLTSSVNSAQISAEIAKTAAQQAKTAADNAVESAESAQLSATQALTNAGLAQDSADTAQRQASTATTYANGALTQLSVVENVVGVLDLLQKNGQYALTEDTEITPEKWYFTRSGAGTTADPYVYTVVSNPTGNPSTQGWYELTGIKQAIQNYVSSHIAIDDQGLWLQQQGVNYKILISSTGVVIYGADGTPVGMYGETAQIGNSAGFHIEMDGTELGFYQATKKVAYISNNQLYITQSVVLQRMDVGARVADNGLGQWSWKIRPNKQNPARNNLHLKWFG